MPKTPASLWSDLSKRRLSWAETAYDEFLRTIAPEIAIQYRDHREEVTVVAFGKTQVGKTTLILQLMGVASESMAFVSQVLRGGRPKGRSSTSTAMVYSRSLDDNWQIKVEGKSSSVDTPEEMESRLAQLRSSMEHGKLAVRNPIQVYLPKNFFEHSRGNELCVNIVDLPGDSPANPIEQMYVNNIAAQYVPNADLILLVGKADDLGFIDPEKLVLPGLGDWRYSPSRFRLITTFTIQSASFRDWLLRQPEVDVATIRTRVLAELATFDEVDLPADAKEPSLYFPLDFGDSWETLKSLDPKVHAQVQPVMSELLEELRKDIQRSASPHMRLWRAKQVHIVANRLKRARQRQVQEEVSKLHAEAEDFNERSSFLLDAARSFQKKSSKLPTAEEVERFSSTLAQQIDVHASQFHYIGLEDRKRVSVILEAIHKKTEVDISHAYEFEPSGWSNVDVDTYRPSLAMIRIWVEPVFSNLHKRLSDYAFDLYQPWLFDSYDTDKRAYERLMSESVSRLYECLRIHWQDILTRLALDWCKKRLELSHLADCARIDAAVLVSKSDDIKRKAENLNTQLQLLVTRLEKDEDNGNRFEMMLLDSYGSQSKELTKKYVSQDSTTKKLLVLMALRQLKEEKDYLFSLGGTGKDY